MNMNQSVAKLINRIIYNSSIVYAVLTIHIIFITHHSVNVILYGLVTLPLIYYFKYSLLKETVRVLDECTGGELVAGTVLSTIMVFMLCFTYTVVSYRINF